MAGRIIEVFFQEPAMILPDFLTHHPDGDIRMTGHP